MLILQPTKVAVVPLFRESTIKRFWKYVDKRSEDECWLWLGGQAHGYGSFRGEGLTKEAHRFSYELAYGKLDPNFKILVCHKLTCPNRLCVNPKHLYAGTYGQNLRDAYRKKERKPHYKGAPPSISTEKAVELRERYKAGDVSLRQLARDFGVSRTTAHRLVKGIRNDLYAHSTA